MGAAIPALEAGVDPNGLLEDWRLYLLADSLAAVGRSPEALAALALLIEDHRESPLQARAYRRYLELNLELGDWLVALKAIEAARQNGLGPALAPEIDELQWRIASEHDLEDLERETASRLLVEHPLTASRLGVVDTLRSESGVLDWPAVLESKEILRRVRNLLDAEVVEGALSTLAAIPVGGRGLDWTFLQAEALTEDRRGAEALALLKTRPPTPRSRLLELRQLRAGAALEAATVRSRRSNPDSAARQRLREQAWNDLWLVAGSAEPAEATAALRRLYRMADPDDHFELALDVLRRMRQVDPEDITGYRDLWYLGWRHFARHNATGAIGIWRKLQDLYPGTSTARQALYWSGVAHLELGNTERGNDLLREVTRSDIVDFYSGHAARRLGMTARRAPAARTVDAWPDDPDLGRAALLSELGLDNLAEIELDLERATADQRAVDGLEALILARQGDRRESIQSVWRAFPTLGKPGQSRVPEFVRQLYYPIEYPEIVRQWARERGLAPHLVYGIIRQESAFDAAAVSRAGARGLMQLMPATGRELAGKLRLPYSRSSLTQPDYSVQLGTQYFSQVLDMFDGNVQLALAGYNGGPFRLRRWWREAGANPELDRFIEGLELSETTTYVKRILVFQDSYRSLYPNLG